MGNDISSESSRQEESKNQPFKLIEGIFMGRKHVHVQFCTCNIHVHVNVGFRVYLAK